MMENWRKCRFRENNQEKMAVNFDIKFTIFLLFLMHPLKRWIWVEMSFFYTILFSRLFIAWYLHGCGVSIIFPRCGFPTTSWLWHVLHFLFVVVSFRNIDAGTLPPKKFPWDDTLRGYLYEIVRLRKNCYSIMQPKNKTLPDYIHGFLESRIKPLWPKDWMTVDILLREISNARLEKKSFFFAVVGILIYFLNVLF